MASKNRLRSIVVCDDVPCFDARTILNNIRSRQSKGIRKPVRSRGGRRIQAKRAAAAAEAANTAAIAANAAAAAANAAAEAAIAKAVNVNAMEE